MDQNDLEQVKISIENLKKQRKNLTQQLRIIDNTIKTISKMYDLIINLDQ